MTPRGAAHLIALRKAGIRPGGFVIVSHGDFPEPDWWRWENTQHSPEIVVRPSDPIDRLDLRCLVGLDLILYLSEWSPAASMLYERLTEYAQEIVVQSPDFEGDVGWWWIKGTGRVEFDDRGRLSAIDDAKAEAVHAALKRDKAGYSAAQAKERAAREAMSWQP